MAPEEGLLFEWRDFNLIFLRQNLTPLTEVMTFEEYIEATHYTRKVKENMRREWDEKLRLLGKQARLKLGFGKLERYLAFKYHRGIHPCSNDEKCYAGPVVKSIEKAVYAQLSRYFLKGVPTSQRAAVLRERLGRVGCLYLGLDVTAWESSIVPKVSRITDCLLVKHMVGDMGPVAKYIMSQMAADHTLLYRGFKVTGATGRMSGDLWTSLGNGFINLMLVKFVCYKLGYDAVGVVEGDDGLFRMDGPVPTREMFARLGFDSKIELFTDIGEAGFCKMKFDANNVQVTNHMERLVKFGWTTAVKAGPRVQLDLLYTKALSLKAEYPHCPVLGPFADYVIRCVEKTGVKLKLAFDEDRMWEARKIENAGDWLHVPASVAHGTRLFYEHVYGVPVAEQQALESLFAGSELRPLDHPLLRGRFTPDWSRCWDEFVAEEGSCAWW